MFLLLDMGKVLCIQEVCAETQNSDHNRDKYLLSKPNSVTY